MDADMTAKVVLFALQAFALILTLIYSADPKAWLSWVPSFGISECGNDRDCWFNQMVYRTESVCFLVFAFNAILSVSGMTPSTVMGAIPSFTAVAFLPLVLTLFPNSIFSLFASSFGIALSCPFLVIMTILLVDFGQTMNDAIFGAGLRARSITINSDYLQAAKIVLIVTSVLLLIGGLAGAIALFIGFGNGWVCGIALALAVILLVLSITEWCEHGNLFASCLVLAYSVWLSYQVLITQENLDYDAPAAAKWIGLIIALLTLIASIFGQGILGGEEQVLPGAEGGPSATLFMIQALVHASAALFIATVLAPAESTVGFVFRVIALYLSLVLYGWVLVAPKVLSSRF
jgi:hypothetical protein